MSLLVKGVYGLETNPKKTPFGLLNHQFRLDGLLNNAGWFNKYGEKLGYGDITIADLKKVSASIPKDELFIILPEFETSWSMPSSLDSSAPGLDYVTQNCSWCILSNTIYRIKPEGAAENLTKDGVDYTKISRQEFYNFVGYNLKRATETPKPKKEKSLTSEEEYEQLVQKVKTILSSKKTMTKPRVLGIAPATIPATPVAKSKFKVKTKIKPIAP